VAIYSELVADAVDRGLLVSRIVEVVLVDDVEVGYSLHDVASPAFMVVEKVEDAHDFGGVNNDGLEVGLVSDVEVPAVVMKGVHHRQALSERVSSREKDDAEAVGHEVIEELSLWSDVVLPHSQMYVDEFEAPRPVVLTGPGEHSAPAEVAPGVEARRAQQL
jgi:hypothetical protein